MVVVENMEEEEKSFLMKKHQLENSFFKLDERLEF